MSWQRRSPIGIDIAHDVTRLLQLESDGLDVRVAAYAEVRAPQAAANPAAPQDAGESPFDAPAYANAVKLALRERGFRGKRAVVGLPPGLLIERHVKVDSLEPDPLRDALLYELEDAFPGDAPLIQYLEVGDVMDRGERRHELVLLAAALNPVREVVAFVERCGLEPAAVDVEGVALPRGMLRRRRRSSDAEQHVGIIHVSEHATLLTICGGGRTLFMKALPLGTAQLVAAAAQRLDLTRDEVLAAGRDPEQEAELAPGIVAALRLPLDSLAMELSACLRYHAASRRSQAGIELFLTGTGAQVPGLSDALAQALESKITRADPFAPAFAALSKQGVPRDAFAFGVALGLALHDDPNAVTFGSVDFLPPDYRDQRARRATRMVALGLAGVLALGLCTATLALKDTQRDLTTELAAVRSEFERSRSRIAEVDSLEQNKTMLEQRMLVLKDVLARARGGAQLRAIVNACPRQVALMKVVVQRDEAGVKPEFTIAIDGLGVDQPTVYAFLGRLQEDELLSRVLLEKCENVADGDTHQQFRIVARAAGVAKEPTAEAP
ncbi:MAG: pilus assembly protein PilM [Planctomycetes bacterium]|nr:pilus assembly protein PilM [Planctomycetota bacterium]MCC7173462.1 pilus assembly protein PilM [Planctomycetota bacterium]